MSPLRKTVSCTSGDTTGGRFVNGNGSVCSFIVTYSVGLVTSYGVRTQEGIKDTEGVEDGRKISPEVGFEDSDGELLGFMLGIDEGLVEDCSDGIEDGSFVGSADAGSLGFVLGVDEGSVEGCSDGIEEGTDVGSADGSSQKMYSIRILA